jgi:hypothetical protein
MATLAATIAAIAKATIGYVQEIPKATNKQIKLTTADITSMRERAFTQATPRKEPTIGQYELL